MREFQSTKVRRACKSKAVDSLIPAHLRLYRKDAKQHTLAGQERTVVMTQKGLRHIALKSRDLKKTEEFYIGVLGCKVAFRHPPSMIFLTTPGSGDLLNFVKSSARASGTQGLEHIGFKMTAAQLKKMERTLKERGVKIAERRGKDAFYFFDPNGYQIEYYCD